MFIKTGDKVRVISGKDKGKEGNVTKLISSKNRVVVEGVNIVKKHQKASQGNAGGINDVEAPIDASNVMIIDPSNNEPTKIKIGFNDGKKVRISKKTNQPID